MRGILAAFSVSLPTMVSSKRETANTNIVRLGEHREQDPNQGGGT